MYGYSPFDSQLAGMQQYQGPTYAPQSFQQFSPFGGYNAIGPQVTSGGYGMAPAPQLPSSPFTPQSLPPASTPEALLPPPGHGGLGTPGGGTDTFTGNPSVGGVPRDTGQNFPIQLQPFQQPDIGNRDAFGRVVPMGGGVGNADGQARGPWRGGSNPFMDQMGQQGAMAAMNNSPFTGYFNNMAQTTTPAQQWNPSDFASFGTYGQFPGMLDANRQAYGPPAAVGSIPAAEYKKDKGRAKTAAEREAAAVGSNAGGLGGLPGISDPYKQPWEV